MSDYEYLKKAYQLALKGKGLTSPNPVVGAVIVKGGRIIGEGWHHRCGGPHAEEVAFQKAGYRAQGAKLYVTLEPCSHYGRTPPCVDQIIKEKVKEVIIGMKDPNPLTNGKSMRKLKTAGIEVTMFRPRSLEEKALRREIERMNEPFVKGIKTRMPFVVTKTAQMLDGKIATMSGQSKWITSQKTRDYAHRLRNEFDAIVVGINTVLKDDPALNPSLKARRLKRIILDSSLRISPQARLFKSTRVTDCFIATTKNASARKIAFWQQRGVNVIVGPSARGRVHLKWLFGELARRGIINILIEGGAQTVGSALRENVVDKMLIFIAPKIMGSQKALSSIDGLDVRDISSLVQLKHVEVKGIGGDFLVEGYL